VWSQVNIFFFKVWLNRSMKPSGLYGYEKNWKMPYFLQTFLTTSATNSFPLSDWRILGSGVFSAENILANALAMPVAFLLVNETAKCVFTEDVDDCQYVFGTIVFIGIFFHVN
jgi:hypothetical protein